MVFTCKDTKFGAFFVEILHLPYSPYLKKGLGPFFYKKFLDTALPQILMCIFSTPEILMAPYLANDLRNWGTFDFGSTFVTVNFNTKDQTLTDLLNQMTQVEYNVEHTTIGVGKIRALPPDSMYNITGGSTLAADLQWAIGQGNCVCETGLPIMVQDSGRYRKTKECIDHVDVQGNIPDGNYPLWTCAAAFPVDEPGVPIYILSRFKEQYIESKGFWLRFCFFDFFIFFIFFCRALRG